MCAWNEGSAARQGRAQNGEGIRGGSKHDKEGDGAAAGRRSGRGNRQGLEGRRTFFGGKERWWGWRQQETTGKSGLSCYAW